ncbi:hypothetical protein SLEP1_g18992 [Rubroshorea leprosula]|nr:hypothetical protein SLEP1_g18992 [Rubroshorea leprosula]
MAPPSTCPLLPQRRPWFWLWLLLPPELPYQAHSNCCHHLGPRQQPPLQPGPKHHRAQPNKKIGIYYDRIEANAYYEDQRFATQQLTSFYQGHKNTSYLNPSFQGQKLVLLGADGGSEYNQKKNSGVYSIDVKLNLRVRFKLGILKTWRPTITPQNPNPGAWQTPCTRERIPQMHKARNLLSSYLAIQVIQI